MNDQNKQPNMIRMPEEWKTERTEDEVRTVGRGVVSREYNTGRYGNGIVVVEREAGRLVEFAGHDALTMQARTLDTGDTRERATSLTQEEIEEA